MADKKLFLKKRLQLEKDSGSVTRYVRMLEFNNKLLEDRLEKAIEFLELQEKHLPDNLGFMWREMVLEEK